MRQHELDGATHQASRPQPQTAIKPAHRAPQTVGLAAASDPRAGMKKKRKKQLADGAAALDRSLGEHEASAAASTAASIAADGQQHEKQRRKKRKKSESGKGDDAASAAIERTQNVKSVS